MTPDPTSPRSLDRPPTPLGDACGALLLPVTLDGALAWAAGEIDDDHLVLECTLDPGAVFAVDLRDRRGWRMGLVQARWWWGCGARCLVTASRVPHLVTHYLRAGLVVASIDQDRRMRLVADAPHLGGYLWPVQFGRIWKNSAAAAGVTISR